MGHETAIRVDITGDLAAYVAAYVGDHGFYETATEYVRDLIRRDIKREKHSFEALRGELQEAFAVPESEAYLFDAEAFRQRMRDRHA